MKNDTAVKLNSFRGRLRIIRSKVTNYLDAAFYLTCRSILQAAMRLDTDNVFRDNPAAIPTYSATVSRSMYWKLIEKNLNSYSYATTSRFIEDMRLVFDNCYAFNTLESPVSAVARMIEVQIEDLFITHLGEAVPSSHEILMLGKELTGPEASRMLFDIFQFYEGKSESLSRGGKKKVYFSPSKCSSACKRRMLLALRKGKHRRNDGELNKKYPPPTALNEEEFNPVQKAKPKVEKLLQLEEIPQNTRSDYDIAIISPIRSNELGTDEDVDFADS